MITHTYTYGTRVPYHILQIIYAAYISYTEEIISDNILFFEFHKYAHRSTTFAFFISLPSGPEKIGEDSYELNRDVF